MMSPSMKYEADIVEANGRKKTGGCYISTLSVIVLGVVFVASLIAVGVIVYSVTEGKYQCPANQNSNDLSSSSPNTYRDFWHKFEQCQTWASGGRLSKHLETTLVSTDWLADKLSSASGPTENLRILDTSISAAGNDEELYGQEHISGALFFEHFRCVNRSKLYPRNLPDLNCFEDYLRSLGISSDTRVIVYDRYKRRPSARIWWILRLHGHDKVSILDGGLDKWKSDGYETDNVIPTVQTSSFQIDFNPILIRDFKSMSLNYEYNIEQVVDARKEEYFTGESTEYGLVPGHIPRSINVPFEEMLNADQTFKSASELQLLFETAGIEMGKPVVATCATGMRASVTAAVFHIMGKIVPVYHGSWIEWSQRADADRIATGSH